MQNSTISADTTKQLLYSVDLVPDVSQLLQCLTPVFRIKFHRGNTNNGNVDIGNVAPSDIIPGLRSSCHHKLTGRNTKELFALPQT